MATPCDLDRVERAIAHRHRSRLVGWLLLAAFVAAVVWL